MGRNWYTPDQNLLERCLAINDAESITKFTFEKRIPETREIPGYENTAAARHKHPVLDSSWWIVSRNQNTNRSWRLDGRHVMSCRFHSDPDQRPDRRNMNDIAHMKSIHVIKVATSPILVSAARGSSIPSATGCTCSWYENATIGKQER